VKTLEEITINRLIQLTEYISEANEHTYFHHLREYIEYCRNTPALNYVIAQLPEVAYDWDVQWHQIQWPYADEGAGFRWSAIEQLADAQNQNEACNLLSRIDSEYTRAQSTFAKEVVSPLSDYLVGSLTTSSVTLYLLWRYKLWAEWFEADRLREVYGTDGEDGLDNDVRRFLFESGVDYPFSKPRSPSGEADVVASLETDDPLVLEIKVWDSLKRYKENRVRDGLRQVMDYASDYGKSTGYVVVFNLDPVPLEFIGDMSGAQDIPRIERDRTYYFVAVNIAEQEKKAAQRDKGRPVRQNGVQLDGLWEKRDGQVAGGGE
jgi:hypothetical protein